MRRTALLLCAWIGLFLPAAGRADELILGLLSYDNLIPDSPGFPGTNAFDISNFTGDTSGFFTPTAVIFQNATLTLSDGSVTDLGNISAQSLFFNLPAVQFPTTTSFTSVEFQATLDQTTFDLPGGGQFTADAAAVDVLLQDPAAGNLLAGDFAAITVSNTPAAVPEPGAWVLLALPAIWILRKARSTPREW